MKFTIVGPQNLYPARKNVEVGDVLYCEKHLDPKFGKTVKTTTKTKEDIGFISAQENTSLLGSMMASEVYDNTKISDLFKIRVTSIEQLGRGKVFGCEFIENIGLEENKEEKGTTKMEKTHYREIKCEVIGTKKKYNDRYTPLKLLKANDPPKPLQSRITYDEASDLFLVDANLGEGGTEDWKTFGHINPIESSYDKTLKTSAELKNILNMYKEGDSDPETDVNIIGFDTQDSVCYTISIKIFGQTSVEKATEGIEEDVDPKVLETFKDFIGSVNLSEKAVLLAYEYFKNCNLSKKDKSRVPNETTFKNYDSVLEDVLYSFLASGNTMLSGPMAAGKNTCLETLAYAFNQPLYETQVNSYIDNETLLGTRTIKAKSDANDKDKINEEAMKLFDLLSKVNDPKRIRSKIQDENNIEGQIEAVEEVSREKDIDFSLLINAMKNGETEISFQPSTIVTAMETGAWAVIDEFNTGQPSVMSVLNSVLDDRKRIQVPGYGLVKAKDTFRLFATMNPDYEGTFNLNSATSSRFTHVEFRAADKITPIILSRVPNAQKEFLNSAEKLYAAIRNGIESGQYQSETINIRGFINAAKAVNIGQEVKRALNVHVANSIPDEDSRKAIKSFIDVKLV